MNLVNNAYYVIYLRVYAKLVANWLLVKLYAETVNGHKTKIKETKNEKC